MSEHGEKLDEKTKTEVQEALEAAKKGNLLYRNSQQLITDVNFTKILNCVHQLFYI